MYLCIDTSTTSSGISLVSKSESLGYVPLAQMNSSDNIIESINKLISQANIGLSDLKGVFVIKGPGSFTGLRVGIAVANQFAHQLKIPIVGLRTDEWYAYRTDEKNFIYLQTMNRDEVYKAEYCHSRPRSGIYTIADLKRNYDNLQQKSKNPIKWIGQLSDVHREKLSESNEINYTLSPDITWQKAVQSLSDRDYKKYDLIEPFYGKEPNITKSKE